MRLWSRLYVGDVTFSQGDKCMVAGEYMRILDTQPGQLVVAGLKGYRLALVQYRLYRTLKLLFGTFIRLCAIWGLSSYDWYTTPTWRDLPLVKRILPQE